MSEDQVSALFLSFLRYSAFFMSSPFPGTSIPGMIRILLSGALAWLLLPNMEAGASVTVLTIFSEVMVGLAMGFVLSMILSVFSFAGEAAGTQMGLGALNAFNVALGGRATVVAGAFTTFAVVVFALGGGPERIMILLARSVELLPPGVWPTIHAEAVVTKAGSELFIWGIRAASPIIAAVFVAQLVLAVLARAVPTLNLFIEGPALTVSSGMMGLVASLDSFAVNIDLLFNQRFEDIGRWFLAVG